MFAAMSIRLRFCAGMAFAVGCHNALYACAGPKEREEDNAEPAAVEMLRVLADGYLANREHFRIVACRITVTQGRSKTIADAIAGAIGESVKHEIVWIVDGKDVVFRELHLVVGQL